ncbi:molybdopterin-guanine dinucleotide biosynthesis protein B [Cytobacillus kochii]|uniref:molybdopterin-guanine dinucleotide biosynthesis protein B n=1 Tax=Cytobacillus kochii TaxID=859143 RepID=UPI0038514455
MVTPKIMQVVGYQNSGKTTFVTQLVQALAEKDLNVATIKHHGHGEPDVVSNKDSSRHIVSGATATIVEGEGMLLMQAKKLNWTLEEQIQVLTYMNPDVIIIEGHKKANYPKVLLLRDETDQSLIEQLSNIKYIVTKDDNNEVVIKEIVNKLIR